MLKLTIRKYHFVILITLAAFSCDSKPNKRVRNSSNEKWKIFDSTIQVHSYSKDGYLDSTIVMKYYFYNENVSLVIPSVIIRTYDNKKNLINEREYVIEENDRILSNESIKQYDELNNLVLEVQKIDNTIVKVVRKIYSNNRLVREIDINQRYELAPEYTDADSIAKYFNERKVQYDTTERLFSYDVAGNLIQDDEKYPQIDTSDDILYYANKYQKQDTTIIYEFEKDLKTNILLTIDTSWILGDKEVKSVSYHNKSNKKHKTITRFDKKGNEIEAVNYK